MAKTALYKFCVSTIVGKKRLDEFALTGLAKLTEAREWKTVVTLLEDARKNGERFPVILSDAAYNSEPLLLWGVLQRLEIKDGSTTVELTDIQCVPGKHRRQDLALRSTGKNIKAKFIRPYAICFTPDFLK
jgi:hypothetical protein